MALTVRGGAGLERGRAVAMHVDRRELGPAHAGDLHVHRKPDPEQLDIATRAPRRLLGEQLLVAGDLEGAA